MASPVNAADMFATACLLLRAVSFTVAETETWEAVNLVGSLVRRSGHCSVLYKNKIIIFGGFNGEALQDLVSIDLGIRCEGGGFRCRVKNGRCRGRLCQDG